MTVDRRVVVLVVPAEATWAPPGREPSAWRLALAEDTYEVLANLDRVDVAVAVVGGSEAQIDEIAALTWLGTPVYAVDAARPVLSAVEQTVEWAMKQATDEPTGQPTEQAGPVAAVVAVSHDVPDLPGLLIGKLFRALGSADIAVCPAEDGSLAAIGVRLPVAGWLEQVPLAFDTQLTVLEQAKPRRHAVGVGPGWHRLRGPADLARLDPGLEGWDVTRAMLSR